MAIKVCPRCQQWFSYEDECEDMIHNCGEQGGASEVLKNEDVIVMGSWEDFTGSAIQPQGMVNIQGMSNNVWGTRAWVEGANVSDKTSRGNNPELFRTRKYMEFIELK